MWECDEFLRKGLGEESEKAEMKREGDSLFNLLLHCSTSDSHSDEPERA